MIQARATCGGIIALNERHALRLASDPVNHLRAKECVCMPRHQTYTFSDTDFLGMSANMAVPLDVS
jgi:hypothetical protein